MELQELIDRVIEDDEFAAELARQAAAAASDGVHSEAWSQYARYFADTPEELAQFTPPADALGIKLTTITTLTTLTTGGCMTTTTTTTTTEVPKLCKGADPKTIAFEVVRREKIYPLAGFPVQPHDPAR
jgi:hypothetical protein